MTCQMNSIANRNPRACVCVCLAFFISVSPHEFFVTSNSRRLFDRFTFEFSVKGFSLCSFAVSFVIARAANTLRVNIYAKFHKLPVTISERRTRGEREREWEHFDIFRTTNVYTGVVQEEGEPPAFISPLESSFRTAFHIDFYLS